MYVSCTPINYLTTPEMKEIVMVTYLYYMLKVSDLLDTVCIALICRLTNSNKCFALVDFLCAAQEEQSHHIPACVPSWWNDSGLVYMFQVYCR